MDFIGMSTCWVILCLQVGELEKNNEVLLFPQKMYSSEPIILIILFQIIKNHVNKSW